MKIINKQARFNYAIEEKLEAGVVLTGGEARAIRTGHINLSRSYAKIINNEVYLINAIVPIVGAKDYHSDRTRKLLLNRSQILNLEIKIRQRKLTLVPLSVYNKHNLIKIELGLGKTKARHEKKETIKKRDIEREIKGTY